jgi:hypothetical protein
MLPLTYKTVTFGRLEKTSRAADLAEKRGCTISTVHRRPTMQRAAGISTRSFFVKNILLKQDRRVKRDDRFTAKFSQSPLNKPIPLMKSVSYMRIYRANRCLVKPTKLDLKCSFAFDQGDFDMQDSMQTSDAPGAAATISETV